MTTTPATASTAPKAKITQIDVSMASGKLTLVKKSINDVLKTFENTLGDAVSFADLDFGLFERMAREEVTEVFDMTPLGDMIMKRMAETLSSKLAIHYMLQCLAEGSDTILPTQETVVKAGKLKALATAQGAADAETIYNGWYTKLSEIFNVSGKKDKVVGAKPKLGLHYFIMALWPLFVVHKRRALIKMGEDADTVVSLSVSEIWARTSFVNKMIPLLKEEANKDSMLMINIEFCAAKASALIGKKNTRSNTTAISIMKNCLYRMRSTQVEAACKNKVEEILGQGSSALFMREFTATDAKSGKSETIQSLIQKGTEKATGVKVTKITALSVL